MKRRFLERLNGKRWLAIVWAGLAISLATQTPDFQAEDTDGDGYDDDTGEWVGDGGSDYPYEGDQDGDGVDGIDEINGWEIIVVEFVPDEEFGFEEHEGQWGYWMEITEWVTTDPENPDTDGDGLPDGEIWLGFNPVDPSDGLADDDGDGLTVGEEYALGTSWTNPDSDGGGALDGDEVWILLTDPLDASDDPGMEEEEEDEESTHEESGTEGGGTATGGNPESNPDEATTEDDETTPETDPENPPAPPEPEPSPPPPPPLLAARTLEFSGGTHETGPPPEDTVPENGETDVSVGGGTSGDVTHPFIATRSWIANGGDTIIVIETEEEVRSRLGVDNPDGTHTPPPFDHDDSSEVDEPPENKSLPRIKTAWPVSQRAGLSPALTGKTGAEVKAIDRTYPDGHRSEVWLRSPAPVVEQPAQRSYLIRAVKRSYQNPETSGEGTPVYESEATEYEEFGLVTFTINPEINGSVSSQADLQAPGGFAANWVQAGTDGSILLNPPLKAAVLVATEYEGGEDNSISLLPIEIKWKAASTFENVEINIDPFSKLKNGNRIFPGAAKEGGSRRNFLDLSISGGIPDLEIFLKAFDVDDPTPHDFDQFLDEENIIDENDHEGTTKGNDNRPDHLDTIKSGFFTKTETGIASEKFDDSGKILLRFNVGLQPGNNYRIAIALRSSELENLQVNDPSAVKFIPSNSIQLSSELPPLSPPLTVWRNLWIESDSLSAIPEKKPAPDFIRRGIQKRAISPTEIRVEDAISHKDNFYANGYLKNNGIVTKILSSKHQIDSPYGEDIAHQNVIDVSSSTEFDGFTTSMGDDDDRKLPGSFTSDSTLDAEAWPRAKFPVTNLVNEQVKEKFRPAFIELRSANDKGWNANQEIPFESNKSGNWLTYFGYTNGMDGAKDVTDHADFWAQTIVAAYQGGEGEDADPNSEQLTTGVNLFQWGETSIVAAVFHESIREGFDSLGSIDSEQFQNAIDNNVAHEIAHSPPNNLSNRVTEDLNIDGLIDEHDELQLMNTGAVGGNHFSSQTIARIRSPKFGWGREEPE